MGSEEAASVRHISQMLALDVDAVIVVVVVGVVVVAVVAAAAAAVERKDTLLQRLSKIRSSKEDEVIHGAEE
jgi:hypothetical protein